MRSSPGFLPYLQSQLHSLGTEKLSLINDSAGLDLSNLISQVVQPRDHSVYDPYEVEDEAVAKSSEVSSDASSCGAHAISNGEVAYCILAGGPNTLTRIPDANISLLAVKIIQLNEAKHVWVMTNPSNHSAIESHLKEISHGENVKLFQQFESVRLTSENQLYLEGDSPSFYPCGNGDVIPALQKSGILEQFIGVGGKHVAVVDVDNILAGLDYELIGHHIMSNSPVTSEVVQRKHTDLGGVLCNHAGFDQIVELFRFDMIPDLDRFKWTSTNSYIFKADLDFSVVNWAWHRTKKEFKGQLLVQYERLIQDITATFQTQYVESHREERYMPIKSDVDLQNASRIFKKI